MGRRFYALVDGSYVIVSEDGEWLFGEAYLIENGKIEMLCKENESIRLK